MKVHSLPSAAIFDMDGVLVDSEPLHTESYVRSFVKFGIPLTHEHYRQKVTLGHYTVSELFAEMGGDMERWHDVGKLKSELLRGLMAEKLKLMPGIIELLEALKDTDIPTALATSAGRRSFSIIMDCHDLRSYFKTIVTWEDVNAIKPDPRAYLMTAQKLGVNPDECIVFEDTPRGVLAAHRAGMKCIAIPTSTTYDGDFSLATLVVNSLKEVDLQLLRSIFQVGS